MRRRQLVPPEADGVAVRSVLLEQMFENRAEVKAAGDRKPKGRDEGVGGPPAVQSNRGLSAVPIPGVDTVFGRTARRIDRSSLAKEGDGMTAVQRVVADLKVLCAAWGDNP